MKMVNRVLFTSAAALALAAYPAFSQPPGPGAQAPPAARGRGFGGPQIQSPEILPDNRVTFRLSAPNATEVELAGEMPDMPTAMTTDDEGVWSVTVGPLKPDLYTYSFTVNGVKALDPRNARYRRNGSRFDNIIIVPGPESSYYEFQDVPHGIVSQVWYDSPSLGLTRRMFVYTPPGYEDNDSTEYPVMYLLHGAGNDEETWLSTGRVNYILDNLIAQGEAKPMIMAILNGNATSAASPDLAAPGASAPTGGGRGAPGAEGGLGRTAFPDSIVPDVIPYVESHYRTLSGRENRAMVGLSMGGAQAVYAGLSNTDQFAWVAGFGGAYVTWPGAMDSIDPIPGLTGPGSGQALKVEALDELFPELTGETADLRLMYMSEAGDDALKIAGEQLKEWLESKGIEPTYIETPGYGHAYSYWRVSMVDLAPRLFQSE